MSQTSVGLESGSRPGVLKPVDSCSLCETMRIAVPVELTIQPRAMLDESHASKNALRAEELNAGEKLAWRLHAGFQTSSSPLPDTR